VLLRIGNKIFTEPPTPKNFMLSYLADLARFIVCQYSKEITHLLVKQFERLITFNATGDRDEILRFFPRKDADRRNMILALVLVLSQSLAAKITMPHTISPGLASEKN
jgi:hypothetical protein